MYKKRKEKKEDNRSKLEKQIDTILSMIILVIYLFVLNESQPVQIPEFLYLHIYYQSESNDYNLSVNILLL